MKTFEINGNLIGELGLGKNYENFENTVCKVRGYYIEHLGESFMNKIDLYIDNANKEMGNSGHTPIITRILRKYLIIKLGITQECREVEIAFQFAHELMHYVFYVKYEINKERAGELEESICSAAALIVIKDLHPESFEYYNKHTKSLSNRAYREGAKVAKEVEYKFEELLKKI